MKLQFRFLVLLLILFIAGATVLATQHEFDLSHSQKILNSELSQRKTYFNNIVSLDGQSLDTLVVDYTFWDDFVTFIKTDDLDFAHGNLDTGLSTFNADADWVYKPNGTLMYTSTVSPGTNVPQNLNLPPAFFQQLSKSKFIHFYMPVNGTIMEVRSATVVPTVDTNHQTPAQGYWLVGKLLGSDYTSTLSQLTQSNVSIDKATTNASDHVTSTGVSFGTVLRNWQGTPVASLVASSQVQLISDLTQTYNSELKVLIIFSAAMILLITLTTWLFVLKPIELITTSIVQKRPDLLGGLSKSSTEFGSLAAIVQGFFQQKTVIAESEVNKQALEQKAKRTAEFIATTTHELNVPLNNIVRSVNKLSALFAQQASNDEVKHQLASVGIQLSRATLLLNDLMRVNDGDGTIQFKFQDFDFGSILEQEVERARPAVPRRIVVNNQSHLMVRCDTDRMGQVITNLLLLAASRSPEDKPIDIIAQTENNQVTVTFHDYGPIIPETLQQSYFDRPAGTHSQTDNTVVLPITKRIVERLGGKLSVVSYPDKGTYFQMTFPGITQSAAPETFTINIG